MGVVYAAYDPDLDRRVALKFLNAERAERGHVREKRLLREAQAMARLSHPNVAVAYEVGLFQQHVFLAMEFVDGLDLRTWLSRKTRTTSEILEVFLGAGRGLAAAHAAGIIHRDFKPANVLVDKNDRPRVTDFGLSRASDDGEDKGDAPGAGSDAELSPGDHLAARLTRTGAVLGTPSYMSREQHVGDKVDERREFDRALVAAEDLSQISACADVSNQAASRAGAEPDPQPAAPQGGQGVGPHHPARDGGGRLSTAEGQARATR